MTYGQYESTVEKARPLKLHRSQFKHQLNNLLAARPWTSYLTCLHSNMHFYKVKYIVVSARVAVLKL